jgi:hypothetical protein
MKEWDSRPGSGRALRRGIATVMLAVLTAGLVVPPAEVSAQQPHPLCMEAFGDRYQAEGDDVFQAMRRALAVCGPLATALHASAQEAGMNPEQEAEFTNCVYLALVVQAMGQLDFGSIDGIVGNCIAEAAEIRGAPEVPPVEPPGLATGVPSWLDDALRQFDESNRAIHLEPASPQLLARMRDCLIRNQSLGREAAYDRCITEAYGLP